MDEENNTRFQEENKFENPEIDKKLECLKLSKIESAVNSHVKIVQQSLLELTNKHIDFYPFFKLRKKIMVLLSKFNHFCLLTVTSKPFENLSLMVIIVNTVFMIFSSPTDENSILNRSETVFFMIYLFELVIKMIGLGLFTPKIGYFRNSWNILDFLIVVGSAFDLIFKDFNLNLSALRSLRVLRPLKTISSIKSLKNIISTVFSSLPFLKDIFIILFFFLILFGVCGLHLFQGALRSVCFDPTNNTYPILDHKINSGYCSDDSICPGLSLCLVNYQNPFFGQTNFDNIFISILLVFQISTMENWTWTMYAFSSGFSSTMSVSSIIFHMLIVVIINFVINNLMLAVIVVKFNESNKSKNKKKKEMYHSDLCICNSGFNYDQMKVCGFFLSLSNLNLEVDKQSKGKKFTYDCKENLKQSYELDVDIDFRFEIIETFHKLDNLQKTQQSNEIGFNFFKPKKSKKSVFLPFQKLKTLSKQSFRKFRSTIVEHGFGFSKKISLLNQINSKTNTEDKVEMGQLQNQQKMEGKSKNNQCDKSQDHLEPMEGNWFIGKEQQNLLLNKNKNESHNSSGNSFESLSLDQDYFLKSEQKPNLNLKFLKKKESIISNKNENEQKEQPIKFEKDAVFDSEFENNLKMGLRKNKKVLSEEHQEKDFKSVFFRRNAQIALNTKIVVKNKRKSILPVQLEFVKNNTEAEESTLPKSQASAEKEFQQFLKLKADTLKLDLISCFDKNDDPYKDMKNTLMPSLEKNLTEEKERLKKEQLAKLKIAMVYNKKYIQKRKGEYDNVSDSEISQNAFNSNKTLAKSTLNQTTYKEYSLDPSLSKKVISLSNKSIKSKLKFYVEIEKSKVFYFFLKQTCDLMIDSEEASVSELKVASSNRKVDDLQKQSSLSKYKTKNFSTTKAFFSEEFESEKCAQTCSGLSKNLFLHQGFINDSIQKKRIFHTNWSGDDVCCSKYLKSNKTMLIFDSLNESVYEIWLPGLIGQFNIFRRILRQFFANSTVDFFFIGLVLINTVIMALTNIVHNTALLDQINTVLTIIFSIEIGLKFIGLGIVNFSRDFFNVFDLIIISLSLVEVAFQTSSQILSAIKVIRMLRTVRILRASRILRNLKFLRTLIKIFEITLEQFFYTTLLLLLFLGIFALIGMQFFTGKFTFLKPGQPKFQNFDSFYDSFLTMLDVMTIENWNSVLTYLIQTDVPYFLSAMFLIIWIFIGNYILLNLFIAVLLDGFSLAVSLNELEDLNNEFKGIEQNSNNLFEVAKKKKIGRRKTRLRTDKPVKRLSKE
jgi:hypothetical protein